MGPLMIFKEVQAIWGSQKRMFRGPGGQGGPLGDPIWSTERIDGSSDVL